MSRTRERLLLSQSYGYTDNVFPAIVMQFSEIIALPSRGKIATRLHGALVKFADRKIARIFRVFNVSAIFQKMFHCQRKICYTQKLLRSTAMQ